MLKLFGQDAVDRVQEKGLFITPNALNNGFDLTGEASAGYATSKIVEHILGIELEPLFVLHDIYDELVGLKAANEYALAKMQCLR